MAHPLYIHTDCSIPARQDDVERRKILLLPGLELRPVDSGYTDCTIPAIYLGPIYVSFNTNAENRNQGRDVERRMKKKLRHFKVTIAHSARPLTVHSPIASGTYRAGLTALLRAPGIPPPASQESRAFCRVPSVHINSHHQVGP
jgi:hypothetical protein